MRIVLLASTICLSGCTCKPQLVYVPVSSCIEPPALSMPRLQVDILPEHANTKESVQALANDHRTMRLTLQQCIVILDGYRRSNQMDTFQVTEQDKQSK